MDKRKLLDEKEARQEATKKARQMGLPGFEAALSGSQFADTVWKLLLPITHPFALLTLSTTGPQWAGLVRELATNNDLWYGFCERDFPQMMSYLPWEGEVGNSRHVLPNWARTGANFQPAGIQTLEEYNADVRLIMTVPWRRVYHISHLAYRQSAQLIVRLHERNEYQAQASSTRKSGAMANPTFITSRLRTAFTKYDMVPLSTSNVYAAVYAMPEGEVFVLDSRRVADYYALDAKEMPTPLAAFGMISAVVLHNVRNPLEGEPNRSFGKQFSDMYGVLETNRDLTLRDGNPAILENIGADLVLPYITWMALQWAASRHAPAGQPGYRPGNFETQIMRIYGIQAVAQLDRKLTVPDGFPDVRELKYLQAVPRWSPYGDARRRPYLGVEIGACCEASENACAVCLEPVCQGAVCLKRHLECEAKK